MHVVRTYAIYVRYVYEIGHLTLTLQKLGCKACGILSAVATKETLRVGRDGREGVNAREMSKKWTDNIAIIGNQTPITFT